MKKLLKLSVALVVLASFAFTLIPPQSKKKKNHDWISLFDGKTLKGWHGYNKKGAVTSWAAQDGVLACLGTAKNAAGGDIVTDRKFANFDLKWEWKVDKGSNSGVMYHVLEGKKWHSPYETGPEYQILDDTGFPEKIEDWQKAGADYAMHIPNGQKPIVVSGEWYTSEIIFNHGHVEHWMNGKKILEFEAWSKDWNDKKSGGKWKDYPDYGNAKTGEIALQDHGDKAYYRNIMIKEL
jgi:3-keto-disaccharide hydrolase